MAEHGDVYSTTLCWEMTVDVRVNNLLVVAAQLLVAVLLYQLYFTKRGSQCKTEI